MHEDLATPGCRDGGEELLLDDALPGGGALVGHADVAGRAVGEGSLLGGACGGAGGLILAGGALLLLSHDGFPISPKWAGLADENSFAW